MTAAKEELEARIDAFARALDGDEFVAAVERLAEEVGPEGLAALEEVLLERAAEEQSLPQDVRRGYEEKGWTRRLLGRLDGLRKDVQAGRVAAALEAAEAGEEELAGELESLRANRGRAVVVLDELSRHGSPAVRAWVPAAAAELLGEDAERLVRALARDRDPAVKEAAEAVLRAGAP